MVYDTCMDVVVRYMDDSFMLEIRDLGLIVGI